MPSDQALSEQADECKQKGNESFGAGRAKEAIGHYSAGIVLANRIVATKTTSNTSNTNLHAVLLSNRAAAHLKLNDAVAAEDDCTKALALDLEDAKVRGKLLFRRAKARFLRANNNDSSNGTATSKSKTHELLQEAAKDLLTLLNTDPNNADAQQLLTVLRNQHKLQTTASSTPVSKTLQELQDSNQSSLSDQIKSLQQLLGLLDHDLSTNASELGRLGGLPVLLAMASQASEDDNGNNNDSSNRRRVVTLALQCVAISASHAATCRTHLVPHQSVLRSMIGNNNNNSGSGSTESTAISESTLVSILAIWVRVILHADRDDPDQDISGATLVETDAVLDVIGTALNAAAASSASSSSSGTPSVTVLRAILHVLSTWTAGPDRASRIRAVSDDLPPPASPQEIRAFTPAQLAHYRKRQSDTKTRDEAWAYDRSLKFIDRGLQELLTAACGCADHAVRREMTVAVGRLMACLEPDERIKDAVTPFLQKTFVEEERIVELHNDDGEEEKLEEVEGISLDTMMHRALLTAALLLSKKDVGAWALSTGWVDAETELPQLVSSQHPPAMCLASEVLQAASTVEASRNMVTSFMSSGCVEQLMRSTDVDIRSGAAAAVAKLGLAAKSSDEGELMGLLQAACDLLEDNQGNVVAEASAAVKAVSLEPATSASTSSSSSVERAIEMIIYLVANTIVKEELAAGFGNRQSALELLVKTADLPGTGESISGFGLATIFQNLAATNEQVRKEAFEGKEVTMEQYDEMQRMGKTDEEKDAMDQKKDSDTREACNERIRKMASANVPRALVALTENASEHSLEQIVLAMNRMADEVAVRGIMIQQGALSTCIKIEKKESPTDTDTMKKVFRTARHCIAKMLISTNPSLLTSAQRLGAVRPLIQLVRDIKASDLQHFEALMAVTNVASAGEDAKNRIVTERGIPCFHFAMFSDHEMVRRAATEALCNLVPHKDFMEHLAVPENLRLWMAFSVDFEDNYECARAATGCLAMATQAPEIANEMVKLEKFREQISALLESGRLELMHRTLVTVLNLVLHGPDTSVKTVEAGLVEFCRAYIELQNHSDGADMEFTEEERKLLPVTIEIAKTIVKSADE